MIQAILWDFGNVLGKFHLDHISVGLARYSPLSSREIHQLLFEKTDLKDLHESGTLSSQDLFAKVKHRIQLNDEVTFEQFFTLWGNIFDENPDILSVMAQIPPSIKRCLLSNTDPIHWEFIKTLPVMDQYFAESPMLIRSYDIGARKPDRRIYDTALERLALPASAILYIDDIVAFREEFVGRGGNVIPYDCSKDSIGVLEEGLKKYGVIS